MLKRVIAGVAVAVMLAGSAAAGPVEDGAAAYKSGDYAEAVKMFRLAADQGIAFAQINLGIMYAYGQGVPQDYVEAVKWYRLAADGPRPRVCRRPVGFHRRKAERSRQ